MSELAILAAMRRNEAEEAQKTNSLKESIQITESDADKHAIEWFKTASQKLTVAIGREPHLFENLQEYLALVYSDVTKRAYTQESKDQLTELLESLVELGEEANKVLTATEQLPDTFAESSNSDEDDLNEDNLFAGSGIDEDCD